jgi:hypothetical protein
MSIGDVVQGAEALGPLPRCAPEVLCSTGGVPATSSSDVYQFGGLLHELLTCGDPPFWWWVLLEP